MRLVRVDQEEDQDEKPRAPRLVPVEPSAAMPAAPQTPPQEDPSFFDKAITGASNLASSAITGVKDMWEGEKEDYPELPRVAMMDLETASTANGKLNMFKKRFPNGERDVDIYGNVLVIPNEEMQGNKPDQAYYLNKPGGSWQDAYEAKEMITNTVPEMAISAMSGSAGILKGMASVGLAAMGGETVKQAKAKAYADEDFSMRNIVTSGLLSSVGQGVGHTVSKGFQSLGNVLRRIKASPDAKLNKLINPKTGEIAPDVLKIIDEQGITPKELKQMVARDLAKGGNKNLDSLTPNEYIRHADASSVGVKPTLGRTTQDPNLIKTEMDLKKSKLGGDLVDRDMYNNAILLDDMSRFQAGTGGVEANSSQTIAKTLQEIDLETNDLVHGWYKQAEKTMGAKKQINLTHTANQVDELWDDMAIVPEIGAWLRTAEKYGMKVTDDKFLTGKLTVAQAEILRKRANQLTKGKGPDVWRAMGKIKDSLDDDVLRHAGEDIYAKGRSLAAKRFGTLHSDEPGKKAVRDLVEGTLDPEKAFNKLVISGDSRNLTEAHKAIFFNGKDSPRSIATWNEIRSDAVKHVMEKATKAGPPNAIGQQSFNGAAFRDAMEKDIGSTNLKLLFTEDELAHLYKISRVAGNLTSVTPDTLGSMASKAQSFDLTDRIALRVPGPISKLMVYGRHATANTVHKAKDATLVAESLNPLDSIEKGVKKAAANNVKHILPQVGVFSGNVYNGYSDMHKGKVRRTQ